MHFKLAYYCECCEWWNFLVSSLDFLVKASDPKSFKISAIISGRPAQKAWEAFGHNISGHSDLHATTVELLLADVSKNFRKVCIEKYGLDPAHYNSSPGLRWDALLNKTVVELELFTKRRHTPNANMADRSVVARNELHESEASEA